MVAEQRLVEMELQMKKVQEDQQAAKKKQNELEQKLKDFEGVKDDFGDKLKEQRLIVAACCVTIVRYLSDGAARLPIGILTRLLQTHDTVLALIPLLEKPPWRRERNGSTEQHEGSQWVTVPSSDRLRLSQIDAQARLCRFLSLCNTR